MAGAWVLEQGACCVETEKAMDNETPATEFSGTPSPTLPRATAFEPSTANAKAQNLTAYTGPNTPDDDKGRTGVFAHLVKGDSDIAGLVAYSIYKQHKLDWLRAFEGSQGRNPNETELASYLIGEGTPRRIATYRHLAEATLSGQGPNLGGGGTGFDTGRLRSVNFRERRAFSPGLIAVYALIALLFVLGFWLALHYTVASR